MFSFLTTKPLFIVCAALVASTLSFSYLSYTFYGDKQEATQALGQALNVNSTLQKSLEKQKQACVIDIKSTLEFQEDKKELETHKEEVIQRIDKLASVTEEKSDEVDIDSKLPDALRGMLDDSFNSIQRKPSPNP